MLLKLKELKDASKKQEYLDAARSLQGYGTVTFPHCPCDARKSGHVIVSVSLRNFQMKACSDQGDIQDQEHLLDWDEISHLEADTEAMALCFQYTKGGKTRWVRIYSEHYEFMSECVHRVLQEIDWNKNDGQNPVLPPKSEEKDAENVQEESNSYLKSHNTYTSSVQPKPKSVKPTKSLPPKHSGVC
ncbi:Sorting nexin-27 [Exaiptasia diaphana]|nr:Sorting nexin-27 [Exaiptasia diaphana]